MILHELTANKKSFRPVKFVEGLNIILAEKSATSSPKDTRNGVGKTTLVEILMFCLGGYATKGKGVIQDALASWVFTLEMTLKGNRVKVSRSIAEHQTIRVIGDIEFWAVNPSYDEFGNVHVYTIDQWRRLLGWALFDLDPAFQSQSDTPVAKGLLSCFIRLGQPAYRRIDFHNLSRVDGAEKINMAYLLGLEWEFIGKIKKLRQDLKDYRVAQKVITGGAFSGAGGSVEEISVEQSKILAEIAELKRSLASFDFSPQYERLQQELNELTKETLALSNQIASRKRRLTIFQTAVQEEKDVSREEIEGIYKEAGLLFPAGIRKTLDDVLSFHKQIVMNRKSFLADEIERLDAEIQHLTQERDKKSKQKAEKTTQLAAQDIYEDLWRHQTRLAELESIERRQEEWISDLNKLDQKMVEIDKDIEAEKDNAQADFAERKGILTQILSDFSSFTNRLYGKKGALQIFPENDDYSISVEMDRGGSNGVILMGILCFDLALLKMQKKLGREISFLVHDTPILDAVDERQVASALALVAEKTRAIHGQYICPMNSDKIPPKELMEDFVFDSHVIHRLSDSSPADSLLGIYFEADA